MSEPRRLRNALSANRRATLPSDSPTRHPSSIRSLRSSDDLLDCLTELRQTNDHFSSSGSVKLAAELAQLSRP